MRADYPSAEAVDAAQLAPKGNLIDAGAHQKLERRVWPTQRQSSPLAMASNTSP